MAGPRLVLRGGASDPERIALLYVLALRGAAPRPELGPLASAAISGGWPRHLWAALVLLVAPPVEEFLFRGVLFTGLRRSWRLWPAGAIVVFLFVVAHFSEIAGYGPGIIAVALVGGATLAARVATRSLVPAIAVHASYNLCIVVWTYAAA